MSDDRSPLVTAVTRATRLKKWAFGGHYDPTYPYHGGIRTCPFCGDTYRIHSGFADHRDKCSEGPNPGANPVRPEGGDQS